MTEVESGKQGTPPCPTPLDLEALGMKAMAVYH